jgi:ankyrin repeat protein
VKLLFERDGVDPDSKDSKGRTPLSWAAEKAHKAIVELLLAKDSVDPELWGL